MISNPFRAYKLATVSAVSFQTPSVKIGLLISSPWGFSAFTSSHALRNVPSHACSGQVIKIPAIFNLVGALAEAIVVNKKNLKQPLTKQ